MNKLLIMALLCVTVAGAASERTPVDEMAGNCELMAYETAKAADDRVSSEVKSAVYFRLGDIQMYSYYQMVAMEHYKAQAVYEQLFYSSGCGKVSKK